MTAEKEYIRPALSDFMYHMERRLRMNEDRREWQEFDLRDLLIKVLEQLGRLGVLLSYRASDHEEIAVRCANAANYLMMIHDRAKAEYQANREPNGNRQ